MNIFFAGIRGLPPNHGGFETHVDQLARALSSKGHNVVVACEGDWKFVEQQYEEIILRYYKLPKLSRIFAEPIYDAISLFSASRDQSVDVIHYCGLSFLAIIPRLFGKLVVMNMDGFEWRNKKFGYPLKLLLYVNAILYKVIPNGLISDNLAIYNYYKDKMSLDSEMIPYGINKSFVSTTESERILKYYNMNKYEYCLMVTRLEETNHIENSIINILLYNKNAQQPLKLVIAASINTDYGKILYNRYKHNTYIVFLGYINNKNVLTTLRKYSYAYIHGQRTGGTSPALIEALNDGALILAFDNDANRNSLEGSKCYFYQNHDLCNRLEDINKVELIERNNIMESNMTIAYARYSLDKISSLHEQFFISLMQSR